MPTLAKPQPIKTLKPTRRVLVHDQLNDPRPRRLRSWPGWWPTLLPGREPPCSGEDDPVPLSAVYRRAIVTALRSMDVKTSARIAEATGLPLQRVDTALRRLAQSTDYPSINSRRTQPDRRDQ